MIAHLSRLLFFAALVLILFLFGSFFWDEGKTATIRGRVAFTEMSGYQPSPSQGWTFNPRSLVMINYLTFRLSGVDTTFQLSSVSLLFNPLDELRSELKPGRMVEIRYFKKDQNDGREFTPVEMVHHKTCLWDWTSVLYSFNALTVLLLAGFFYFFPWFLIPWPKPKAGPLKVNFRGSDENKTRF